MKITIEHYDIKVTWEGREDVPLDQVKAFIDLMVVAGYTKSTMLEIINLIMEEENEIQSG